jgi:hypothetical protein
MITKLQANVLPTWTSLPGGGQQNQDQTSLIMWHMVRYSVIFGFSLFYLDTWWHDYIALVQQLETSEYSEFPAFVFDTFSNLTYTCFTGSGVGVGEKRCTCQHSRCIKLYCVCWAAGEAVDLQLLQESVAVSLINHLEGPGTY